MNKNHPSREAEILSPMNRFNETIMIALRTSEGLDLNRIEKDWDSGRRRELEGQLSSYSRDGFVKLQGSVARLTEKGMLRADGIAASLFV
jgi:oxygen-independent coproporphyrinogen-3 oxidase